jgi:hypothetical protein
VIETELVTLLVLTVNLSLICSERGVDISFVQRDVLIFVLFREMCGYLFCSERCVDICFVQREVWIFVLF